MSAHSSSASLSQERLGHFREKHDAYKTLISHIADRLSSADLRSVFWYIDASPKLRTGSALDVLEYLEMAGHFSERNVEHLSHLLKEIKRIDLMNEVDSYSLHYGRHFSLPGTTAPSAYMHSTPRSCSVGSHRTGFTPGFPYQETAGGPPPDPSLEQAHPSMPGGWRQRGMHSSETSPTTQKPAIPIPALSQGAIPYSGSFATSYVSPGLGPAEPWKTNSWNESHSLSNSGSIHLNYSSYPSSHNASQEVFQPQRIPMPTNEEAPPHFGGMQMPAEYYNNIIPRHSAFLPSPTVQQNWYQQTSLGSIPQGIDPAHAASQGSFDVRSRSRSRHNSAADIRNSSSQEYPTHHHRYSQPQVYNHQYYTPPYSRRTLILGGSNIRASPVHSQPIRECDDSLSQQLPPISGLGQHSTRNHSEERRRELKVATPTSKEEAANGGRSSAKQIQTNQSKVGHANSGDYLPPYDQSENVTELAAVLKKQIVNNGSEVEAVVRRRTNSLQRVPDQSGRSLVKGNKRRLSLMSVASYRHVNGAAVLVADNTSNHLIAGSKGSTRQSSSTLNSDDSRFSPTNIPSAKSKPPSTNLRANRQKETFLSRLTQQFSRIVRPHKEIEWEIKRSKLNRIIYEQTDKFLTCPYKLELDGGLGASNPRLTLYVHPYGCEDDCNVSITLEVGIEISTRPKKAQRLDSRAEVEVSVKAEDRQKKAVFGKRLVRESVRLNYFFIKGFLSHHELKLSHSEYIVIIISANLISANLISVV